MLNTIITIGDKIDLVQIMNGNPNNTNSKQYLSKVLDVIDDSNIKISMPIENIRIIPLTVGDKYQLCFYANRGLYQCKGIITNRYKDNNLYILDIQFTSDLEKLQRREFYRLSCVIDINYKEISEQDTDCNPAVITDISGGGARFNSKVKHEKGEKLILGISFHTGEGTQEYDLKATIISSIILPNRVGFYENRVEFSEIEIVQRETIIRFVFEEERKQRRRERGILL